ncbi:MAG: hypothetical protein QG552_3693 [Thermodesulfobacteriota bacterium]|nr:hypothetical protein [Thermodesulfobacteriota bacterium]
MENLSISALPFAARLRDSGACLGNQASPALGAARLEHLPAVAGGHPCPETVGACAFDAAGLKGSLHSLNLLWNLAGLPGVGICTRERWPVSREKDRKL